MTTKRLENLWSMYPGCHLHCDVTAAGQNAYRLVVSLLDEQDSVVARIEHYGSGNLDVLKEAAFEHLLEKLEQGVEQQP